MALAGGLEELLRRFPPVGERQFQKRPTLAVGEKVEGHECRRVTSSQLLDARARRMETQLQGLERLLADDNLSVQDKALDGQSTQGLDQLKTRDGLWSKRPS
jgi:hypothetical protein